MWLTSDTMEDARQQFKILQVLTLAPCEAVCLELQLCCLVGLMWLAGNSMEDMRQQRTVALQVPCPLEDGLFLAIDVHKAALLPLPTLPP